MPTKEKDIRDLVVSHLEKEDLKLKWLSRRTNIPYGTMYSIFVKKDFEPGQKRLDLINEVLGTEFVSA